MIVFVDTSALYALLDADDDEHAAALAILTELVDTGAELVTHDYVVVETTALIQARLGMAQVRRLHERVLPAVTVEQVGSDIRGAAVSSLLAANRRSVSLVDWVSFELMRRSQVEVAFAFDDDFSEQGFALYAVAGG